MRKLAILIVFLHFCVLHLYKLAYVLELANKEPLVFSETASIYPHIIFAFMTVTTPQSAHMSRRGSRHLISVRRHFNYAYWVHGTKFNVRAYRINTCISWENNRVTMFVKLLGSVQDRKKEEQSVGGMARVGWHCPNFGGAYQMI